MLRAGQNAACLPERKAADPVFTRELLSRGYFTFSVTIRISENFFIQSGVKKKLESKKPAILILPELQACLTEYVFLYI